MEHSGLAESEQNQSEEPAAAAAEDAGDGEEAEFQITDAVGDDNEQPEADQKQEGIIFHRNNNRIWRWFDWRSLENVFDLLTWKYSLPERVI